MTSNIGAEYLVTLKERDDPAAARAYVLAEVRTRFRPEFLNRIDEIIVFHRLRREDMAQIVDIQIARLAKLLSDRKIKIKLDEKARSWLANQGYAPAYGARPLKRVIQRNVQDPLAEAVLAGTVNDGATVNISVSGGKLAINGKEVVARAA